MNDVQTLLARQAEWQKKRRALPWPEKIHMAESIRESVLRLRRTGPAGTTGEDLAIRAQTTMSRRDASGGVSHAGE